MSTITRLVYSKSGNSVRIYIDDKYAFSLSPNEVVRQKIDKDQVISPSKLKQLKHSGDYEKNYLKALNLISYRPRSAQEIKQYLHRNSVSPIVISQIISTLKKQNYLNDSDFALAYAKTKVKLKNYGPYRLQSELSAKGISDSLISQTIDTLFSDQDTLISQARLALNKKTKAFYSLPAFEFKRKATQYLYRLGYDPDTINRAISSIDENPLKR